MKEYQTRSQTYQYKVLERISSDDYLKTLDSNKGLTGFLNYDSEEVKELQDQLLERLWQLIDIHCTDKQKLILNLLYKEGLTQQEVADFRGISQSTVNKCIHGNVDYKNNKRTSGGIIHKLQPIFKQDTISQNIINQIKELKS